MRRGRRYACAVLPGCELVLGGYYSYILVLVSTSVMGCFFKGYSIFLTEFRASLWATSGWGSYSSRLRLSSRKTWFKMECKGEGCNARKVEQGSEKGNGRCSWWDVSSNLAVWYSNSWGIDSTPVLRKSAITEVHIFEPNFQQLLTGSPFSNLTIIFHAKNIPK